MAAFDSTPGSGSGRCRSTIPSRAGAVAPSSTHTTWTGARATRPGQAGAPSRQMTARSLNNAKRWMRMKLSAQSPPDNGTGSTIRACRPSAWATAAPKRRRPAPRRPSTTRRADPPSSARPRRSAAASMGHSRGIGPSADVSTARSRPGSREPTPNIQSTTTGSASNPHGSPGARRIGRSNPHDASGPPGRQIGRGGRSASRFTSASVGKSRSSAPWPRAAIGPSAGSAATAIANWSSAASAAVKPNSSTSRCQVAPAGPCRRRAALVPVRRGFVRVHARSASGRSGPSFSASHCRRRSSRSPARCTMSSAALCADGGVLVRVTVSPPRTAGCRRR